MIRNCVNLRGWKRSFRDRGEAFAHPLPLVIVVSHAGLKSAEIVHLGSKHQIGELSVRQEDDEEHDGKAHKVLGAARHGGGQLTHGLVEVDELEKLGGTERIGIRVAGSDRFCSRCVFYLDPREEDNDCSHVVELDLQVG